MTEDEIRKKRYYEAHAHEYDAIFSHDRNDEHYIASALLNGLIRHFSIKSLLDVGCGTGRTLVYLKEQLPDLDLHGIEPIQAMIDVCCAKGIACEKVLQGDACALPYDAEAFDCVSLFGVLHHIRDPELAIREAFRVSRRYVYISDHNIYAIGGSKILIMKRLLRSLGLRKLLFLMMTRGRGYYDTVEDGVFYPFSLVDQIPLICSLSKHHLTLGTRTPAVNFLKDASHFSIFAVKST